MDQFGFVGAVDGLGERVVVAVTLAAYRWLDARLREAFAVAAAYLVTIAQ